MTNNVCLFVCLFVCVTPDRGISGKIRLEQEEGSSLWSKPLPWPQQRIGAVWGGQVAAPGKVWENTLHPDGALHTMGHSAASQIIFNLLTLQLFYFIEFSL